MPATMPSSDSQKSMPSVVASKLPEVSTEPVASSSMTAVGGTRPPGPTIVVAGCAGAVPTTVTSGDPAISVVVRLVPVAPPGRNSVTSPVTVTRVPTAGVLEGR